MSILLFFTRISTLSGSTRNDFVLILCSYGAACLRASPVLVLTLIGGGVFANPEQGIGSCTLMVRLQLMIETAIAQAIARAHAEWTPKCPALKRVVLPLFPIGEHLSV